MGGAQYKSETPQQLILTYESSAGSSGSGSSPEANASLNSSTTNTASTTSTSRHLNRSRISDDEVIFTVKSQLDLDDYDIPTTEQPSDIQSKGHNHTQLEETEDFLPICDALFNVICLVGYFCDIVFDVLAAYSFYQEGQWEWALVAIVFIVTSMVVCQVVSFGWYWGQRKEAGQEAQTCSTSVLVVMHLGLCGVLWRYFKLFIPVDIRFVKSEVRDLCLLRLIHAFIESAPMLLLQLYLTFLKESPSQVTYLTLVSTTLSLFTLCWALASYSKNIRKQNVHKLVLTWLGVIFQFLWRLGTVTARVTALAAYATVYSYWLFLVLILHWFCMVLWIMSPRNIFSGEKLSGIKKTGYSALISVVYLLCFINVQEVRSRQKVTIFYVTMFLENTLLVGVWLIASRAEELWYHDLVISVVFGAFVLGIFFMTLYYSYFHVRKLSSDLEDGKTKSLSSGQATAKGQDCDYYSSVDVKEYNYQESSDLGQHESGYGPYNFNPPEGKYKRLGTRALYNKINGHHIHHPNVPGVFNCRFNPAMKRKKKKPSSFVPPPPVLDPSSNVVNLQGTNESITFPESKITNLTLCQNSDNEKLDSSGHPISRPGKMANPFWKRPHSVPTVVNEHEESSGSVSSSRRYRQVDIHQKLQAKKEQQIADLKAIEEEIRQGKLRNRPSSTGILEERNLGNRPSCQHLQGPPPGKQPPWFRGGGGGQGSLPFRPPIIIPSGDELMLDPHYLLAQPSGPSGFYERLEWNNFYEPVLQAAEDEDGVGFGGEVMGESVSDMMNDHERKSRRKKKEPLHFGHDGSRAEPQFFNRGQGSFPNQQSYGRSSRRNAEPLPSTNSSDADVDSGGEDEHDYEDMSVTYPPIHHHQIRLPHQHKRYPKQKQPETPL